MTRSRGSAWDPATATRASLLTGGAAGARAIGGAVIIVNLVAGSGDVEDELFTLNTAGKAIWDQPGGQRSLAGVVAARAEPRARGSRGRRRERDLLGLVAAIMERRSLVTA